MYNFCTYFNINFIAKGLALYSSLLKNCPNFILWVLCFDELTYEALNDLNYKNVRLIKLSDFENNNPAFFATKKTRNTVEYYWTSTSVLIQYLLLNNPQIDTLAYLDADLYFFSNPKEIYDEFGDNSIMIIPHRLAPIGEYIPEKIYGFYNVGMLIFKNDLNAKECLHWWKNKCLEWCYDRVEKDRYGDQKYLDEFPHKFRGVHVLSHLGANVAPWNIEKYWVTKKGMDIFINKDKLIFFHFSGFKIYLLPNSLAYGPNNYVKISTENKLIYRPYIAVLTEIIKNLKIDYREFNYSKVKKPRLTDKIKSLIFIQYIQYFFKKITKILK